MNGSRLSVVSGSYSGLWLLVTGCWPEARNEKPTAKTLTPESRGKNDENPGNQLRFLID